MCNSTGSGDVDTSTVVKADDDGCIRGASGTIFPLHILLNIGTNFNSSSVIFVLR